MGRLFCVLLTLGRPADSYIRPRTDPNIATTTATQALGSLTLEAPVLLPSQETGKRKEHPQSSDQAESSKRRETEPQQGRHFDFIMPDNTDDLHLYPDDDEPGTGGTSSHKIGPNRPPPPSPAVGSDRVHNARGPGQRQLSRLV